MDKNIESKDELQRQDNPSTEGTSVPKIPESEENDIYRKALNEYSKLIELLPKNIKIAVKLIIQDKVDLSLALDDISSEANTLEIENRMLTTRCNYMEGVLGFRNRCEMLEESLYPKCVTTVVNNREFKWKIILEIGAMHPVVQQVRQRINNVNMSINDFSSMTSKMYESHSNYIHQPGRKLFTVREIEDFIAEFQGVINEKELNVFRVLFVEFDFTAPRANIELKPFKFIRIRGVPSNKDVDARIKQYFRSKSNIVNIEKEEEGSYFVEFTSVNEAIRSYLNHKSSIYDQKIRLELCNNENAIQY